MVSDGKESAFSTPMFIAALFIIARIWRQLDVHQQMKKAVVHIHNGVLLSH